MAARIFPFVDLLGNTYGVTPEGFIRKKKSRPKKSILPPPHTPNVPHFHNKSVKFGIASEKQFINFYEQNEFDPAFIYGPWHPNSSDDYPNRFASPTKTFDSHARVRTVNSESEDFSRGHTSDENNLGIDNRRSRSQARVQPQSSLPVSASFPWSTVDTAPRFEVAARQLDHTVKQAINYFDRFMAKYHHATERVHFCANTGLLNHIWQTQIAGTEKAPGLSFLENKPPSVSATGYTSIEDLNFREHQQRVIKHIRRFLSADTTAIINNTHGSTQTSNDAQKQHRHYRRILQDKVRSSCSLLLQSIHEMTHDHRQAEPTLNELHMIDSALQTYRRAWDKSWSDNNPAAGNYRDNQGNV